MVKTEEVQRLRGQQSSPTPAGTSLYGQRSTVPSVSGRDDAGVLAMLLRRCLRIAGALTGRIRRRAGDGGPVAGNSVVLVPTVNGQALLARLACSDGRRGIWCVQLDLACHFVIDSRHDRIYAPARYLEMPAALLDALMACRDTDYIQVDDSHLEAMRQRTGASRMLQVPFEQFAWLACQRAEPRLPLPGDLAAMPFRLARWPGFTRLKHDERHIRWSGRLMQESVSLAGLATVAADFPEVAKFYNACAVAGLLAAGPRACTGALRRPHDTHQMRRQVTG
jgi:hypothetical protein